MLFRLNQNPALLLLAATLISASGYARAEQPLNVLTRAIGEGEARGEMTGEGADFIRTTTHSSAPVMVHAKVIKRFKQAGCARVAWDVSLPVPTSDGKTVLWKAPYEISVCVDGSVPIDAPDTVEFKKKFNLFSFFGAQK